jgi:L-arabinokinase
VTRVSFVFYISGHGLGHIARQIEVVKALAARMPDARFIIRTSAPSWFISASAPPSSELQPADIESGVVQIDSLSVDPVETARRAASFYGTFDHWIDREAGVLDDLGASLVVSDVPPLAFAAAARAGVPSVAIANFTWDWIYRSFPRFDRIAPGVLDLICRSYSLAGVALRLPLHAGFEPMSSVIRDNPLIARKSRAGRERTREILNLEPDEQVVLASFGGHGLSLPLADIARANRFTLLVADPGDRTSNSQPNTARLRRYSRSALREDDLDYPDLVAAADVVVSKPGYGIISECAAQGTALLYTSREGFIEQDILVREMPDILRCRYLSPEDLRSGRWSDAIDALLSQPPPPRRVETNGADVAASEVLRCLGA